MFDSRIVSADAPAAADADGIATVYSMLARLGQFAIAGTEIIATQHEDESRVGQAMAQLYASANSITRRRYDAILHEAEMIGAVGLKMLLARGDVEDASGVAAARFLGNRLGTSLGRLEALMMRQAA